MVDMADGWREGTCEYPGRSVCNASKEVTIIAKVMLNIQKSAEVVVAKGNFVPFEVKDRINRSPQYDRERRNG
jgi:hypothetical protein